MSNNGIDLKNLSNDPNCRGADGYDTDVAAGIAEEQERKRKEEQNKK